MSTVRATRAASEDDLAGQTRVRLAEMLASGTTTVEAKSGYGLDVESELRMLRVIAALNELQPIELAATFMGAHEVPPEFRGRQREYVDLVTTRMIPAAAALAEWCDVFCDRGFFTPEESIEILEAGKRAGMKPRIHADELAASSGPAVAARTGAQSADHLVQVTPEGIAQLAGAGTVATLLPAAAFFLKLGRFAPARDLIAAGVPVALATDVNPGGGFSPSMPFVMTLACFAMGLTFEEALAAATINGAFSLDRSDRTGSLEAGKQFDAVLVDGPAVNLLRINAAPIAAVFKKGLKFMLVNKTVQELLDAFAAPTPTPGGGSAAALAGAVAASILTMVATMPKTKSGTPEERAALNRVLPSLRDLRAELTGLVDRDAASYDAVVAAYRCPRTRMKRKRDGRRPFSRR